jgi:hypothetical protein
MITAGISRSRDGVSADFGVEVCDAEGRLARASNLGPVLIRGSTITDDCWRGPCRHLPSTPHAAMMLLISALIGRWLGDGRSPRSDRTTWLTEPQRRGLGAGRPPGSRGIPLDVRGATVAHAPQSLLSAPRLHAARSSSMSVARSGFSGLPMSRFMWCGAAGVSRESRGILMVFVRGIAKFKMHRCEEIILKQFDVF